MIDASIKKGVGIYNKEIKGYLPQGVEHTDLSTGLDTFTDDISFKVNMENNGEWIFFQQNLPFIEENFNLENDNAMIIICRFETISITRKENIYYYFDSHPKREFEEYSYENGIIIPFDKLKTLIDFLNNQRFLKDNDLGVLMDTLEYTTFNLEE